MIAQFVYTIKNQYQADSVVIDKLVGGNGIINQPQIQYIIDNLDATFVSSIAAITSPGTIDAKIEILLSADFVSMYPTPEDRNVMLKGLFQGIISTGLPCVGIIETIIYV